MRVLPSGVASKQVLISNQGPYRLANKSKERTSQQASLSLKQICSVYTAYRESRRIVSLTISKMRAVSILVVGSL